MGELFDLEISDLEINAVLGQIQLLPQHSFQILTKQIRRAQSFQFPSNAWVGITLDCLYTNEEDLDILRQTNARIKFVSFEPLLGDFCGSLKGIDWVIIGSLTGIKAKQPPPCSVPEILIQCNRLEIPVFLKNNLEWPDKRQEFPKETTR
jgi:protein gp37